MYIYGRKDDAERTFFYKNFGDNRLKKERPQKKNA
jgi:hypothetical protein